MTEIRRRREMNFSALISGFFDHLFFVSDFRQLTCRDFLQFSHIFPLLPSHLECSVLEASEKTCVLNCSGSVNLFLLQRCDLRDIYAVHLPTVLS